MYETISENSSKKLCFLCKIWRKFPLLEMFLLQTHCQQEIELYCFSDLSLQSYHPCKACVYIRAVSKSGVSSVYLVASKSRLAPIKNTIPRLELLGTILLGWLMASVKNALSKVINISNYFYWTDSMATLAWITSQGKHYKTFVENRVKVIQQINQHVAKILFVFSKMIYGG